MPRVGFIFMPAQATDSVSITAELPIGTPIIETEAVLKQLENIVASEIHGYKRLVVNVGQRDFFGIGGASSGHRGSLQITLPDFAKRTQTADEIKTILRGYFDGFPGVTFSFGDSSGGMGGGGMGGSPVDILVKRWRRRSPT